jgi:signal transduction histidine kinase/HD-like signal output (HDOD) protein
VRRPDPPMPGDSNPPDAAIAERVELILRELDALPTLSTVAVRLLELTADADADAKQVIDLVSSDPALAGKVLALCRCHERGRASQVATIDRAVLLLGFEAVRFAVLSVQVFDVLDSMVSPGGEAGGTTHAFDREGFWLHALGVAVASEQVARQGTLTQDIRPGEAFMAGLLHDLGQLVLHVLLPESFDRVCRVAETHSASLDHACRQIIGIDSHTAGKRLAEHWGLPRQLVDVIWLNGQPFDALPHTPDRTLVALVTLADALVRNRYVTAGGQWSRIENLNTMCIPIGVNAEQLDRIARSLHERVAEHAAALGLAETCGANALLRAMARANESLARASAGMRQREQLAQNRGRILQAIRSFYDTLNADASQIDTIARIAISASSTLKVFIPAALYESVTGDGWRFVRFTADGRPHGNRIVDPPDGAIDPGSVARDLHSVAPVAALLPWVEEYFAGDVVIDGLRTLPLASGAGGGDAILLIETADADLAEREELQALLACWRAALAGGAQQDRASHLTEELAEANRELIDVHEALARTQTLATLGEVAAGAAHEMNNPLTIISGRSQLLANRIKDTDLQVMAREINTQSHRLSDMITALRSFAEPVRPDIRAVDLADLVMRAVQQVGPEGRRQPQVNTVLAAALPPVWVDPDLIGSALGELVRNAAESKGSQHIELRVQTAPIDDRLKIEVRDDGSGLSEHATRHAFDPFFSAKPAGRQPGLGLARARRAVEAHGGRITLVNGPSGGAVATVWLDKWRREHHQEHDRRDERDAA